MSSLQKSDVMLGHSCGWPKEKKNVEKGGKRRKKNGDEGKRERNRITIRRYLLFHRNWSLSFYPLLPPQPVPCHRFSESLAFSAASLYRFVSPRLWAFVMLFNIYSLTVHVPGQFPGASTTIQNIIEYRPIIATVLSSYRFGTSDSSKIPLPIGVVGRVGSRIHEGTRITTINSCLVDAEDKLSGLIGVKGIFDGR